MSQNCFFRTHYREFFGDSEKNTHLFFGYLVRILRGVDFLRFSPKFYYWINYFETRHQIQMSDKPVLEKCFEHTKHLTVKCIRILGQIIFLEVKFQNFPFKYSMKKIIFHSN
jgi:hypothetical protein